MFLSNAAYPTKIEAALLISQIYYGYDQQTNGQHNHKQFKIAHKRLLSRQDREGRQPPYRQGKCIISYLPRQSEHTE